MRDFEEGLPGVEEHQKEYSYMNRRTFLRSGAMLLAAGALAVGSGYGIASAHEHRTVGDYNFVVGFLNEPAVQGELNAVSVRVTQPAPADATPAPGETDVAETPVKDLELTVEVILGDQKVSMPMEAKWGDPGHYVAYVIPSQPGDYSFHVTGDIDGQAVDETFTAGPETFSTVSPRSDLEFPKAS
jgi:hypothetical protein